LGFLSLYLSIRLMLPFTINDLLAPITYLLPAYFAANMPKFYVLDLFAALFVLLVFRN